MSPRGLAAVLILLALSILPLTGLLASVAAEDPPARAALAPELLRRPDVVAAVREIRAIRDADSVVIARVHRVHESPGIWCGVLATRQEVTWDVIQTVAGRATDERVRAGHYLVAGSPLVAKAPYLRPELFREGALFLLCLSPGDDVRQVADEAFGARPLDPPPDPDPDLAAILRLVTDLPELAPYFHPEVAGRTPLAIALTDALGPPPSAEALGREVRYVQPGPDRRDACLEIMSAEVGVDSALIRFAYRVEGVTGTVRLARGDPDWKVVSASVSEE